MLLAITVAVSQWLVVMVVVIFLRFWSSIVSGIGGRALVCLLCCPVLLSWLFADEVEGIFLFFSNYSLDLALGVQYLLIVSPVRCLRLAYLLGGVIVAFGVRPETFFCFAGPLVTIPLSDRCTQPP